MSTIASLVPKVFLVLVDRVKARGITTYGEVAAAVDTGPRVAPKVLQRIRDLCVERGWPPLTAIVVSKATSLPGDKCLDPWISPDAGSDERHAEWQELISKVYSFDWDSAVRSMHWDMQPS